MYGTIVHPTRIQSSEDWSISLPPSAGFCFLREDGERVRGLLQKLYLRRRAEAEQEACSSAQAERLGESFPGGNTRLISL